MLVPDTHRELLPTPDAAIQSGSHIPGLPEIPLGWTEVEYRILNRSFRLMVPFRPDSLLDSPEVLLANADDDYMPYWAYLWPAALRISESVLRAEWPQRTRVLELGCGLGLVGIAAMAAGCQVSLTDYDHNAVTTAKRNAELNGFLNVEAFVLDWRKPPNLRYQVIIGCDVTYESRNHAPILDLIDRMLAPDGFCWIADGGRSAAPAFVELAKQRGFGVSLHDVKGDVVEAPGLNYVLMEVIRR